MELPDRGGRLTEDPPPAARTEVYWISPQGVEAHAAADLPALLERDDGFAWVDVPVPDDAACRLLTETFGAHPLAVEACRERSHVPRIHAYPEHIFLVLHGPLLGDAGHVHLLELDQLVGHRYLVTIHGPLGEGVPPETALRETRGVLQRIHAGRFRPASPAELSHAIVSGLTRSMEGMVSGLATRIAGIERQVMKGEALDPEEALEELFRVRHELLTVRTMAAQSREAYVRMLAITRFLPEAAVPYVEDLLDQFDRIRSLADGEKEFLQGVVDYYQSRTATKINIAMERLALIAALVLPISAVAGIYGMNIIVPARTNALHLAGVLAVMALTAAVMLVWAKRHDWW